MKPQDLKPHVLVGVQRAATAFSAVKFRQVRASMNVHLPDFDDRDLDRDLDRALQALRREKQIEYLGARDPKTGKPRRIWGWRPVAKPASTKRGARRG